MRNMKRILFVLAIIMVLTMAGTAFAHGGRGYAPRGRGPRQMGYDPCPMSMGYGARAGCPYGYGMGYGGGMGHRGRGFAGGTCPVWGDPRSNSNAIPQDIQDKMREMHETGIALQKEFANRPINSERVLELRAQHFSLSQEVSEWFFRQRLEALED